MKILYAAYKHDPQKLYSMGGADTQFVEALKSNDIETTIIGPFIDQPVLIERGIRKLVKTFTKKQYLKYNLTNTYRASINLSREDLIQKPDLIFTLYPPPLVFYRGNTPCVFRTDATILGVLENNPEFYNQPWLLRNISLMMEKSAINKSKLIITHSHWSQEVLIERYRVDQRKIFIFPNPSSLPGDVIPEKVDIKQINKFKNKKIMLLFVGSDPYRKGLDIAIQATRLLNARGIKTILTICGVKGEDEEDIQFMGFLKRNEKQQFEKYLQLLESSHLLIHPARFDPAPRVTSEAAAFGTPTITNNSGGLGTSVKDCVSGVVLPKGSSPEAYAQVIKELVEDPERYYALCKSTRERYENELNWDVAGKKLSKVLHDIKKEKYDN